MRTFFELINLFSWKIGFNYQRKQAYHSFFGFILSILVYILSIGIFYYYSIDVLYKKNPKIIYKESVINKNVTIPICNFIKGFQIVSINNITNEDLKLTLKIKCIICKTFY